ncbi:orotidine-5'-phosphate decarboxylase [Thiolapillus sp.]
MTASPVIVALDFPDQESAMALVERLHPSLCRLKVGKELFTRLGPAFVEKLVAADYDVFLDLKFHDIPNTVAAACDAAADLGVWMMNLHACGGRKMMETASARLAGKAHQPKLIAVTILTSLGEEDILEIGFHGTPAENVLRLAALAESSGMDGVVCSPLEVAAIRTRAGNDFLLVTPGVRPAASALDDQKRVMTPPDAMQAGSSYLVVGRPVTAAPDPLLALQDINASLQSPSI